MKLQIHDAVLRIKQEEAQRDTGNSITGGNNTQENPVTVKSTFLLVLQTRQQQHLLQTYGNTMTMMDAVYRTTKYGFPCFFLTVKTSIGIGRVVGTIITQYENEELLTEGLRASQCNSQQQYKSYAFNSFFYPKLLQNGYKAVQRWTRKVRRLLYCCPNTKCVTLILFIPYSLIYLTVNFS